MRRTLHFGLAGFVVPVLSVAMLVAGCSDTVLDSGVNQPEQGDASDLHQDAGSSDEEEGYIIVFREDTSGVESMAKKMINKYSIEQKHIFKQGVKGMAGTFPPGLVKQLEQDESVAWIEKDLPVQINPVRREELLQSGQSVPWGIEQIEALSSSAAAGSVPVDIYILDSGVSHADIHLVEALDFTASGGNDPVDRIGHGTHIAGTAAALDNDAYVVGAAPGARVHSLKVLDNSGSGRLSNLIAALGYVVEQKSAAPERPMVVNISLGFEVGTTDYNALDRAVAHAVAQGIVVCVAAGNEGVDASLVSPAHVAEALTVGAYDSRSTFASFSNYGSVVDLLAPGQGILSTAAGKAGAEVQSGTSMAAAHVSGAAALYLASHPAARPAEVAEALRASSRATVQGVPAGTTDRSLYAGGF